MSDMANSTFHPMKLLLFLPAWVIVFTIVVETKKLNTFLVSFQEDHSKYINHWIMYKENITGIEKEFTSCHWEKIRFFSMEFNSIWAYCFTSTKLDVKLPCIQFYHSLDIALTGRKLDLVFSLNLKTQHKIVAHSVPYRHREWNHICFTYSSVQKQVKFYHNGKIIRISKSLR